MKSKILASVMIASLSVMVSTKTNACDHTNANTNPVNANKASTNADHPISLGKFERKGSILPITNVTKPVVIPAGKKQFVIVLKSNPSTGYRWELTHYDHSIVASAFKTYVPTSDLVGGGGQEQWYFNLATARNNSPKKMTLTFEYRRPWDKPEVKHQVVDVKVIIANRSS